MDNKIPPLPPSYREDQPHLPHNRRLIVLVSILTSLCVTLTFNLFAYGLPSRADTMPAPAPGATSPYITSIIQEDFDWCSIDSDLCLHYVKINGGNFTSDMTILVNDQPVDASFVSSTVLAVALSTQVQTINKVTFIVYDSMGNYVSKFDFPWGMFLADKSFTNSASPVIEKINGVDATNNGENNPIDITSRLNDAKPLVLEGAISGSVVFQIRRWSRTAGSVGSWISLPDFSVDPGNKEKISVSLKVNDRNDYSNIPGKYAVRACIQLNGSCSSSGNTYKNFITIDKKPAVQPTAPVLNSIMYNGAVVDTISKRTMIQNGNSFSLVGAGLKSPVAILFDNVLASVSIVNVTDNQIDFKLGNYNAGTYRITVKKSTGQSNPLTLKITQ